MRLALIGTGRMGTPIAARLRAAGHRLVVHDAAPEARRRLADDGFEVAADPAAAVRGAEAGLLCLPDAGTVTSVVRHLPQVPLLIDLTSVLARTKNSEVKFPRDILTGTYASGFTAGLMLKDVGIAIAIAAARGQAVPLAAAVHEEWRLVVHALGAGADFTRVYEVVA